MATKIVKGSTRTAEKFSKEERSVVMLYRDLSQWEKNAAYIILQSLSWGNLTAKTDGWTWPRLRKEIGLKAEQNGERTADGDRAKPAEASHA